MKGVSNPKTGDGVYGIIIWISFSNKMKVTLPLVIVTQIFNTKMHLKILYRFGHPDAEKLT